ncbi:MAG TPA: MFS transporter [Steroidobacteraceae bacterium]|jgi:ACS family glucarate transporter-like MFS transporter|nr:MFS transporter [Steroidobacteraceae bacterium]
MSGYAIIHRIRWRIFGLLFGFGCIAFLQQKSVTVAAARMMPELGMSQMQIGWIEWAFVLGYTVFQLPGGIIGQRLGARRAFVLISTLAFLATVLTPLSPIALSGTALFVALLGLQLLLGSAQGPVFPVSSGVMETWFPPSQWALVQGLQVLGLQLAAALSPPLIATIMASLGWQQALFWPALPALALIAVWAWYGRNAPAQHPAVTAEELAELGESVAQDTTSISWRGLAHLLSDRSIVLLTFSYTCMNYVFYLLGNWCFLYLVQERHFGILEGGWLAAAPPLAAAAGAGLGGKIAGDLCTRFGVRWGFRLVPLISLPAAGALLLGAVYAPSPYVAVFLLALCFGTVELNEGPYWAATMYVARSDTMAATGILNTGGNGGGLIGIPIVAYLSGHGAWKTAFAIGTVFALVSAVAWMGVDTTRRVVSR